MTMFLSFRATLCAGIFLVAGSVSVPAHADTLRHWETGHTQYRAAHDYPPAFRKREYSATTESVDENGQPVTTHTDVEYKRNEHTVKTRMMGPDGMIGSKKVETRYERDEIETKTTTTDAEGVVDIQREP